MVRLNRIYTRTGDDGTTGLVDGSRVPKDGLRMAAIGEVDELNSLIGVAVGYADDETKAMLGRIQNELFDLGADLATPKGDSEDFSPSEMVLRIVPAQVERLEREIDRMNDTLAPLRSFVLPGGTAAHIHVARAATRRAERAGVAAAREVALNPAALAYLNRLSDHLFVLARAVNAADRGDILWQPGATRES